MSPLLLIEQLSHFKLNRNHVSIFHFEAKSAVSEPATYLKATNFELVVKNEHDFNLQPHCSRFSMSSSRF